MARKRSRIAGMKMPFVVTMSVAASACGGTFMDTHRDNVETGGTGGDDPGSTGGTNPGTGGHESGGAGGWTNGGAGGWTNGGAGGIDWGGAGGFGAGGSGGGWGGAGGSNPPPPNTCPVEAPPSGGPCVATGGPWPTICRYPGNAPCMSDRTFECTNGTWIESVTYIPTCNPPPPPPSVTCPAIEPTPYTDSCRGPGGNYYTGPDCGYGDCYGQPVRFWKCTPIWEGVMILDYVWSQSAVSTCNPPPPYPGTGGTPAYDAGAAIPPNP